MWNVNLVTTIFKDIQAKNNRYFRIHLSKNFWLKILQTLTIKLWGTYPFRTNFSGTFKSKIVEFKKKSRMSGSKIVNLIMAISKDIPTKISRSFRIIVLKNLWFLRYKFQGSPGLEPLLQRLFSQKSWIFEIKFSRISWSKIVNNFFNGLLIKKTTDF